MKLVLNRATLRLIAYMAATLIVAWVGSAGAWVYFLRTQRSFTKAEFSDTLLPWRWRQLGQKRGEFYISTAENYLSSRNITEALHYLRGGLGLAPSHLQGRLLLARIYHSANRVELATQTLVEGLPHHVASPDYARLVLQYLLDTDQYALAVRHGDLLLAQSRWSRAGRAALAVQVARAAIQLGRYLQAENYLSAHCDARDPNAVWLRAMANLDLGYPELARQDLENAVTQAFAHGPIFELLAAEYRRDRLAAREALLLAQALTADPLAWPPRLAFVRHHHAYQHTARLTAETAAYLRLFGGDEQALLALADFCATTGQSTAARQVRQVAEAQGRFAIAPFWLLEAEACVAAGENQACLQLLEAGSAAVIGQDSPYFPALLGLRAAAFFGLQRPADGQAQLDQLLAIKIVRPENLAAIATRLAGLGLVAERRRLLDKAFALDPGNQRILSDRLRLDLDHEPSPRLPELAQIYANLPRPSAELLARLRVILGGDSFLLNPRQTALFAALDQAAARRTR